MRLALFGSGALIAAMMPAAASAQGYPASGIGKPSLTGFPSIGSDTGLDGGSLGGGIRNGDTFRLTSEQYRRTTALSRREAKQAAEKVRAGAALPDSEATRIRGKLRSDLAIWRDQFQVSAKAYGRMRDHWLPDTDRLSAAQWAQQRADWFDARDAWVAANRAAAAN